MIAIPKGRSKNLFEDFTSSEDIERVESILESAKEPNGRTPHIGSSIGCELAGAAPSLSNPTAAPLHRPFGGTRGA